MTHPGDAAVGFGKLRLAEQTYTSGQIDVPLWADDIENGYLGWCAEQGLSATRRGERECRLECLCAAR